MKRKAESADRLAGPSSKKGKKDENETSSSFRWITPSLGPKKTCLHGINLTPESRPKVATFDLDGTIIKSSFRKKQDPTTWQWETSGVPLRLKEAHEEGYSIVLITNQAISSSRLPDWKKKVALIATALPNVPFRVLAATAKDQFRKPMIGMWIALERLFTQDNVEINKSQSYFVGDAAGRSGDHAGTDRKWALNVGIKFLTPEEYFANKPPQPYTLKGFNASSLPANMPLVTPTSTPILPPSTKCPELVLFVGYPCLGKSTFFRRYFASAGYKHINQDTLKTRDKCVKAAREALESGQSCVIDNTNRNQETRKHYIKLCKDMKVPARCFHFSDSEDLAWHNNLYRAYHAPLLSDETPRDLLPYVAFSSFKQGFEEPTLEEGFAEIKRVNWKFEGTDEARKLWSMWLQLDE